MATPVSTKDLRSFGLIVGGIFLLIGAWPLFRGREPHRVPLYIAIALVLPSVVVPRVLLWPYRVWMVLGSVLGAINSRIILGVLFFLIVVPVGWLRRRFGTDTMGRSFDHSVDSYAIPSKTRDRKHFEQRF